MRPAWKSRFRRQWGSLRRRRSAALITTTPECGPGEVSLGREVSGNGRCAARFNSINPPTPCARFRRSHRYPVSLEIPKLWHSSLIVCSSLSYSKTNRSFSFHHAARFPRRAVLLHAIVLSRECQECSRSVLSGMLPVCTPTGRVSPSPVIFWNQEASPKSSAWVCLIQSSLPSNHDTAPIQYLCLHARSVPRLRNSATLLPSASAYVLGNQYHRFALK